MSTEIEIKQEWLVKLRESLKDKKPSGGSNREMPWTPEEEDFLCDYYHKQLADIGYVQAKHLAMALERPLGGVYKKISSLRVEGRMEW